MYPWNLKLKTTQYLPRRLLVLHRKQSFPWDDAHLKSTASVESRHERVSKCDTNAKLQGARRRSDKGWGMVMARAKYKREAETEMSCGDEREGARYRGDEMQMK